MTTDDKSIVQKINPQYEALLEEFSAAWVEKNFNNAMSELEARHTYGEIIQTWINQNPEKAPSIKAVVDNVIMDLQIHRSTQFFYQCVDFYNAFPQLEEGILSKYPDKRVNFTQIRKDFPKLLGRTQVSSEADETNFADIARGIVRRHKESGATKVFNHLKRLLGL